MSFPVLRSDTAFRHATPATRPGAMECDWCGGSGQVLVRLRKPHGSQGNGLPLVVQEEACAKCDGRGTIEVRG